MPHKPPINLKELKERGMLDEEKFYSDLAMEAGLNDPEIAQRVYLALVRLISTRLVESYGTRLPHLGEMAAPMFKEKIGRVGDKSVKIPPRRVIKFYSKPAWQKHMSAKFGYTDY